MPDVGPRWELVRHLIDTLRQHASLVGVQVEPGWPGDQQTSESVWVNDLDGEISIPLANAGRKYRDDIFRIPFEIRVANRGDLDSTADRTEEIVNAIDDVLADDPALDEFPGLVSAEITSNRTTFGRTPEGVLGFGEVVVSAHLRLS